MCVCVTSSGNWISKKLTSNFDVSHTHTRLSHITLSNIMNDDDDDDDLEEEEKKNDERIEENSILRPLKVSAVSFDNGSRKWRHGSIPKYEYRESQLKLSSR